MLFEFHESQNSQEAGSVHATYLVYGENRDDITNGDEDIEMSSSPPGADADSISELTRSLTLNLVEEDRLKGKKEAALPHQKSQALTSFH